MSRRARVDATLFDNKEMQSLGAILDPDSYSVIENNDQLKINPEDQALFLSKGTLLEKDHYRALLQYFHLNGRAHYRAFDQFPHPQNSVVVPPQAQFPLQIHRDECTFSCQKSHYGNSAIQFYNPATQLHDTGFIQIIWHLPLENIMHHFIVVQPHKPIAKNEEKMAPYIHYPGLSSRIVDSCPPTNHLVIIEPKHIITHLTTYKRPASTYGIGRETLIVCWALNRGRK